MQKKICIFGSYKALEKNSVNVEEIGKKLALSGYIIVSGGFGGTMKEISKGAKKGGGETIGVTCYIFPGVENTKANDFIDIEIKTENLFTRIKKMMEIADAFIIFPGGTGTLLEFVSVLEHINKGLMRYKPIIFFGDYWEDLVPLLKKIEITDNNLKKKRWAIKCIEIVHLSIVLMN